MPPLWGCGFVTFTVLPKYHPYGVVVIEDTHYHGSPKGVTLR